MSEKVFAIDDDKSPESQIGATIETLADTIADRRDADDSSYTHTLLSENHELLLTTLVKEMAEVTLTAKDIECAKCNIEKYSSGRNVVPATRSAMMRKYDKLVNALRCEIADVLYHTLVVAERYDVTIDEIAAELNNRMSADERPEGGVLIDKSYR